MIAKTGKQSDIILLTGEYYDDHPMSPVGVIARVLDAKGYRVGIIEKPQTKEQYLQLGCPRLCFGITSGSIDSMVHNYTPLKRKRSNDPHNVVTPLPDRAVIVYCNKIKQFFKSHPPLVIGGIEASLRRFAHYDYWNNSIRRSILFDSRADILVYGNGEKQIIEIMKRLEQNQDLRGIEGTCIIAKNSDSSFEHLPSFEQVRSDPKKFCLMQRGFSNDKNLAQEYTHNYVLQYKYPTYTSSDLDWIYSLPFTRRLHPRSLLKMAQFSVVTHRGCIGNCHFCSLSLHQGKHIISRSEKSILQEIRTLTSHEKFKGFIDDLGGPSANMYGMDCVPSNSTCHQDCLICSHVDMSHTRLISLLQKTRTIPGIKKIYIRSGIRYDLALKSTEFISEISKYHISGCLKIAPEHFSKNVLRLMNKENTGFEEFVSVFSELNKKNKQSLQYYFMIGHPGDTRSETQKLQQKILQYNIKNISQFQLFTPTPMTVSSCMYWTKLHPFSLTPVHSICDYKTKKQLKRIMLSTQKLVQSSQDASAGFE